MRNAASNSGRRALVTDDHWWSGLVAVGQSNLPLSSRVELCVLMSVPISGTQCHSTNFLAINEINSGRCCTHLLLLAKG